ncbi:DUF2927 domain-containing protein [Phaeobacter sp. J2-8]|uniref:DUF2927 domain-containing protein n=1 Tax=Phaeobacter sp. J2-8 TaxID=2931394 RepID=UPI001FD104FE|nr:DUF2927 domain-containing protein [Phaeobacter sp. J2-8]MCJ7873595.1 DUF2927 domain-containing protein [Phaeobacter sp. J2-8]
MRMPRRLLIPFCLMLGACMPVANPDTPTRAASMDTTLPVMKTFSVPRPTPVRRSNADTARDFMDLTFKLESGLPLPSFSRFEGPIAVRVTGDAPAQLDRDLKRLVHRLRSEAAIDIQQVAPNQDARITIHAVSSGEIRRALPMAACFVVPNVSSLAEYKRLRRSALLNWAQVKRREKIAIFIPNDSTPQEMRDCLHEELAQSLGPLNDLYRLSDSVFNDDNVHTVLTGFDMLVLRATYDRELHSGMSRAEVARRIPGILARINPQGQGIAPHPTSDTPRVWIEAIQTALGPGTKHAQRRRSALEALKVASAMGWNDHRRAFSHYAMGRILLHSDPDQARAEFEAAKRFYEYSPSAELHQAYAASQLAALELARNNPERAMLLIGPHIDTAARHENAALLSTLMMLRAKSLDLMGRVSEAREVRMDSLGWARYGFGADWAVRAKLREISSLSPLKGRRG